MVAWQYTRFLSDAHIIEADCTCLSVVFSGALHPSQAVNVTDGHTGCYWVGLVQLQEHLVVISTKVPVANEEIGWILPSLRKCVARNPLGARTGFRERWTGIELMHIVIHLPMRWCQSHRGYQGWDCRSPAPQANEESRSLVKCGGSGGSMDTRILRREEHVPYLTHQIVKPHGGDLHH